MVEYEPSHERDNKENNAFYRTLAKGYFPASEVVLTTHSKAPLSTPLRNYLAEEQLGMGSASLDDTETFIVAPSHHRKTSTLIRPPEVLGNQLYLDISTSSFGAFHMTRSPKDRQLLGNYAPNVDPISVSTVLETADQQLVVIEQSRLAAVKPGGMTTLTADPDYEGSLGGESDLNANGEWDPFKTIARSVNKAVGLDRSELKAKDMAITGVVFNEVTHRPVITAMVRTHLSTGDILGEDTNGFGVNSVRFLPVTLMDEVTMHNVGAMHPDAMASLLLYGRVQEGEEWYQSRIQHVKQRASEYQQKTLSEQSRVDLKGRMRFKELTRYPETHSA